MLSKFTSKGFQSIMLLSFLFENNLASPLIRHPFLFTGFIPCKLISGLEATSIYVSTFSIMAIALDRYRVIIHSQPKTCKPIRSVIILVIIFFFGIKFFLFLFPFCLVLFCLPFKFSIFATRQSNTWTFSIYLLDSIRFYLQIGFYDWVSMIDDPFQRL